MPNITTTEKKYKTIKVIEPFTETVANFTLWNFTEITTKENDKIIYSVLKSEKPGDKIYNAVIEDNEIIKSALQVMLDQHDDVITVSGDFNPSDKTVRQEFDKNNITGYKIVDYIEPVESQLANARDRKLIEIKGELDKKQYANFEYLGLEFYGSKEAQDNLVSLASVGEDNIAYKTARNEDITLYSQNINTLVNYFKQIKQWIWLEKYPKVQSEIATLSTIEEINSYTVDYSSYPTLPQTSITDLSRTIKSLEYAMVDYKNTIVSKMPYTVSAKTTVVKNYNDAKEQFMFLSSMFLFGKFNPSNNTLSNSFSMNLSDYDVSKDTQLPEMGYYSLANAIRNKILQVDDYIEKKEKEVYLITSNKNTTDNEKISLLQSIQDEIIMSMN